MFDITENVHSRHHYKWLFSQNDFEHSHTECVIESFTQTIPSKTVIPLREETSFNV